METNIENDIKVINEIAARWKAVTPASGQLHIATGALGTAADFANHHLKLAADAAAKKTEAKTN